MKLPALPSLWLRLRLALAQVNPAVVCGVLLLSGGAAALAWLAQQDDVLQREQELARRMAALPAPPAVQSPRTGDNDNDNLAAFHAALGERRYAEQQVDTLFALAARTGLVLRQGEYKPGYDRNARVHTYQINLPVSGSYRAIWQFALLALRAIPFASLDDISFRRDAIGDAKVEARLRLTLYLAERGAGGRP
jgi:hypothetical protein